ncbi:MAG: FixH family protein [Phenylobacterium sp.]|uniref:FixH family protein n=1 Tax=Phenylobacterium sp. TaxID=1871053 RepID=UPI00391CF7D3
MTDTTPGFRIRGWHVLVAMIGFFGVITAVNAVMITLAIQSFPGQVSVTPYEDGIAYNRRLAQMAAQERLGWRAVAGVRGEEVVVEIRDRLDGPVEGLKVTGRLERPATESGRINPAFKEIAPGVYAARAGAMSGAWDLTFDAVDAGGRRFEGERRLMWR